MSKIVSLAGNAFITAGTGGVINDNGLANWNTADTICSAYFYMTSAALVTVGLNASLAGSNNSTVRVTINGTPFVVALAGTAAKTYAVGAVNVAIPSYVKVDLQGVTKDGGYFGDVSGLTVTTTSALTFANDPANYSWSRRGPSVHMTYAIPNSTEYFYNEVTVPVGEDAVGSYFMVAGFSLGYSGLQVQENGERWVIFSVWNTSNVDKTTLVSKGAGVVDQTFEGEGTGGKAYLVFNWAAGSTYKFITRIRPEGLNTLCSAWFLGPESPSWRYIATWKRPSTNTYQANVWSFLENFAETKGYTGRRVQYGNQWARNVNGTWSEVTTARYTGDPTAKNAQRMDYAGGLENGRFYLRNGGFFSELEQDFNRPATGQQPTVDVTQLPTQ